MALVLLGQRRADDPHLSTLSNVDPGFADAASLQTLHICDPGLFHRRCPHGRAR